MRFPVTLSVGLRELMEAMRGPLRRNGEPFLSPLAKEIAAAHRERMREAEMPDVAIRAFLRALDYVRSGGETLIPEAALEPVGELPRADSLARHLDAGRDALPRTVVIKLNGGLGTSMGLSEAKSLLPARDGESFLDLIARQTLWLRQEHDCELPLLLMNSFRTRDASLEALARHPGLERFFPLDFLQHRVPRIGIEDGLPIRWPARPELEWCPPGHGDLFPALQSSGLLDRLRAGGIRYAFVSNADNLGGVLDLPILGWFASGGGPLRDGSR